MPGEHVSHHFEIDAYLAEALSVTDLKPRQEALGVEEREAERLISLASAGHVLAEDRLEVGRGLLAHCDRLYATAADTERRQFNQAFFTALYVDTGGVTDADLNPPFAQLGEQPTWTRSAAAQSGGRADQSGVAGGRGEVAEQLPAVRLRLLRQQAHVVRVCRRLVEDGGRSIELSLCGQALDQPVGAQQRGALEPGGGLLVAVEQSAGRGQQATHHLDRPGHRFVTRGH